MTAPSVDYGVAQDDRLTTVAATNPEALARILELYARPGQTIVDPTWGRGVFWKQATPGTYNLIATDIATDGVDMRALPLADAVADMVVLDPPYRYTPARNVKHGTNKPHGEVDALYNLKGSAPTNTKGVVDLYRDAMIEAHRVLRLGGFCVVKCQDTIQDGKQIWVHCLLLAEAERLGFACRDMLVVAPASVTKTRWAMQRHLRKGHSYFLVLRKGGHFPFGLPSVETRDATAKDATPVAALGETHQTDAFTTTRGDEHA